MAVTIRNRATAFVAAGAPYNLPFVPLPTSALVLAMICRQGVTYPAGAAPAGWTARGRGSGSGDAYQVCTAPGTVLSVPATGQVGDANRHYVVLEVDGGAHASAQAAVGAVMATPVVSGTVAPTDAGQPGAAVAVALGLGGDFPEACWWNDVPGWTKEYCGTFAAGGFHPWWAVFSRAYPALPASVSDTFPNGWGGWNAQVTMLTLGPSAGAPGVMPRIW